MDGTVEASGLTALVGRHRAELLAFLKARCGNPAEAEDLLQDLWLKVSGLKVGPIGNPRGYLFRMANNLVLDQVRAKHRAMRRDRAWIDDGGATAATEDRPDPAPAVDELMLLAEEEQVVRRAIADLSPGAQRALRLVRLEGRDQGEAAMILGISRSGVEKHLATAMRQLRKALADCGYFDAATSVGHEHGDTGNGR